MKKKLVSILLVLVMVLCLVPTAMAEVSPTEAEAYAATRSLLFQQKDSYSWAKGNINSNDWCVFGLASDGVSIPRSYINSVKAFTPTPSTRKSGALFPEKVASVRIPHIFLPER